MAKIIESLSDRHLLALYRSAKKHAFFRHPKAMMHLRAVVAARGLL